MWVLFGILPPVLIIGIIVAAAVFVIRGRAAEGGGITFAGVLMGYVAVAMLVSVFLFAAGGGLLIKAGLSGAVERDFSYDTTLEPRYGPYEPGYLPEPPSPAEPEASPEPSSPTGQPEYPSEEPYPVYPEPETWVDPSDNALRNDIAAGVTLVFVGLTLFAVHGIGAVVLRRRGTEGARLVSRSYNLLGLAAASIALLGSGGGALHGMLRRYVLETENIESWELPHPGEPLAFAVVFLPLALWFGWRVWQEFTGEAAE